MTSTNADPAIVTAGDPIASDSTFVLVEIDATTDASAPNQFTPDEFRLADPSGTAVAARAFTDASGNAASVQLQGRDSIGGVLVFPTDSFVSDLDGYTFIIDRDERVPTVLSFSDPEDSGYPVVLEAGAAGAFEARVIAACVDNYETSVTSAEVGIDADLGDAFGVVRSMRGQRWLRVVLDVTNATVQQGTDSGALQLLHQQWALPRRRGPPRCGWSVDGLGERVRVHRHRAGHDRGACAHLPVSG